MFLCYASKISLNCTKNFQTAKMYLKNSKVNNTSMEMNLQQAFEISTNTMRENNKKIGIFG